MALKADATRDGIALLLGGYLRVESVALIRPGGLLPKRWQAVIRLYTKDPGDGILEPLGQCVDSFDYEDGIDPMQTAYARLKAHTGPLDNLNSWVAHIGGDC